jgi:hypothetical protein
MAVTATSIATVGTEVERIVVAATEEFAAVAASFTVVASFAIIASFAATEG